MKLLEELAFNQNFLNHLFFRLKIYLQLMLSLYFFQWVGPLCWIIDYLLTFDLEIPSTCAHNTLKS